MLQIHIYPEKKSKSTLFKINPRVTKFISQPAASYIDSWIILCIVPHKVIALPTIALNGDIKKKRTTYRYRLKERVSAKTITIAIVGRAIAIEREMNERSKEIIQKKARRLRAITFQRAKGEKSTIAFEILEK